MPYLSFLFLTEITVEAIINSELNDVIYLKERPVLPNSAQLFLFGPYLGQIWYLIAVLSCHLSLYNTLYPALYV
jgi:hypothetical protein